MSGAASEALDESPGGSRAEEGRRDTAPLVEMRGIHKHFPGVHALNEAELVVHPGEVVALMGENGAGKSTLMKVLSGIYHRDAGEVRVAGRAVEIDGPRAAQALGIGIIHQELALMNDLTAAQNIFIGREPRRRFGRLDEERLNEDAAALFARMGLDLDPRREVGSLTIALQQMIEIAKALSFDSRVLIMDEPTAALNDREIADLFRIVGELRAAGVGIVYISHRMDELKRIADRVTVMRDGEHVGTRDVADVSTEDVVAMMVGRRLERVESEVPDHEGSEVLLSVEGLCRGRMVRDVSFDVRAGEILGLAGLMGAGRTEAARLIFGADPREAGTIRLRGRELDIASPADAVAAGIGYLSEDRKRYGLALGMSVRDNVALASLGRFAGIGGRLDDTRMAEVARRYVADLSIRTPHERQEVRLLSGGNQQKVVIAKWLLRDCQVLIFDEPTRGVDVGAKAEIHRLIEALAAEGRAIVVISSELPEVLRLSHRVAVMCEGRLTGVLPGGPGTSQEDIMALATRRGGHASDAAPRREARDVAV